MAYSGTVSETIFTTRQVIETAARRCQIAPSTLTADSVEIASNALYLLLSDLANQGAPLWCVEKQLYPLYEGVPDIVMAIGTVDVLNGNTRRLQVLDGIVVDAPQMHEVVFTTAVSVAVTAGRLRTRSAARCHASRRLVPCARRPSAICTPTRCTGSSEVSGSW